MTALPGNPTRQRIAFCLKPVQVGFYLRDAAGDLFRTTAEVHPAKLIQLRLQMVYFALPVGLLFQQGAVQRFLFGQALFQQKDVVRGRCCS
ncbi:Uncharacterised protein [Enterobacter hormaechei]|nr:Uncharacterised protein [Enterobacter hormaechei]